MPPDSDTDPDPEGHTTDPASLDGGVETADVDGETTPRDERSADDASTPGTSDGGPGDGATPETTSTNGTTPAGTPDGDSPPDDGPADETATPDEDRPGDESAVPESSRPATDAPTDETPVSDGESDEPRAGVVRLSTLFEVLGNERRRHVIQVLRERESVGLAALAEAVAARENGVEPDALTRRQQKATYTALQQTHLPKMDAAGVLTFDKSAGEVTAGDAIVEYTMYLDVVPSGGVRRSELYLYVAAAGGVVAAGLWAGLPPFVWLAPLAWSGLFVVSVAVVAVVQLYYHPLFPERLPVG